MRCRTLFTIAVCHARLRTPESGLPAAHEAVQVADVSANPTARAVGRYVLGLLLKKSDPGRAQTLLDQAVELGASVQNSAVYGLTLMEAASTRAVHGDPSAAARMLVDLLEHWDRFGDISHQWIILRYAARLLLRLGADDDALALHRALVGAGVDSPLSAALLAVWLRRTGTS